MCNVSLPQSSNLCALTECRLRPKDDFYDNNYDDVMMMIRIKVGYEQQAWMYSYWHLLTLYIPLANCYIHIICTHKMMITVIGEVGTAGGGVLAPTNRRPKTLPPTSHSLFLS